MSAQIQTQTPAPTVPAQKPAAQASVQAKSTSSDDFGDSIDDLVPDILLEAHAEHEKELQNAPKQKVKPAQQPVTTQVDDEDEDEPDDEFDAGNDEDTSVDEDEEDLDTSPEALEKLLKDGDVDAVKKKKDKTNAQDEIKPAWADDTDYTEISKKLTAAGVKPQSLDGLLRKVSDMSKIESSEYVQNLKKSEESYKSQIATRDNEIKRLRTLERDAHFDHSQEVRNEYHNPMSAAIQEIDKAFKFEGITLPVAELLRANNRTEYNRLLSDFEIDENSAKVIYNNWKNYQEISAKYLQAKSEARTNLAKHLSTEIPKENIQNFARRGIISMAERPGYEHVKQAIQDGFEKHPDIGKMMKDTYTDFLNLSLAISNPIDHIHSEKFMNDLAEYVFSNVEAKHFRPKYFEEVKKSALIEKNLKKVMSAYIKLKKAAGGIQGIVGNVPGRGRNTQDQDDEDDRVARMEKLMKNDGDLESLLGLDIFDD